MLEVEVGLRGADSESIGADIGSFDDRQGDELVGVGLKAGIVSKRAADIDAIGERGGDRQQSREGLFRPGERRFGVAEADAAEASKPRTRECRRRSSRPLREATRCFLRISCNPNTLAFENATVARAKTLTKAT